MKTTSDQKFILSSKYQLPEFAEALDIENINEFVDEEMEMLKNGELFFLSKEGKNNYIINPTIREFLIAFTEAKTIVEVINEFAKKVQVNPNQIAEVMQNFFNEMRKEKILISEKNNNTLKALNINDPKSYNLYEIGDSIDGYEIKEVISLRKETQLYLCRKPNQTQDVVIKIYIKDISVSKASQKSHLKKFIQEFEMMKEVGTHPGICKLLDLKINCEYPYAVLEYIKGESIRHYFKHNEITIKSKIRIIYQVLELIAFVQEKNILHGDLHLSNFLINENNQVKLIDFGLSNHEELKENEIIRNGGVHHCIPPERVGEGAFKFLSQRSDFRSEVFQIGVIIFYILYLEYPFQGLTWKSLGKSIKEKKLDFSKVTKEGDHIPEYIIELLSKAMQKTPEDRFENVNEMSKFLLNITNASEVDPLSINN